MEREVIALAVKPCGEPSSPITVITVTPLANEPITRRNRCRSMGFVGISPLPTSCSHDPIADHADPLDLTLDLISGAKPLGGISGHTHARGCSARDNITRLQRHPFGK